MKEATYEGETEVDEEVGKVIKRRKSCNTAFQTTSILSFWSTSVNNISEYGKFIDVVFYHFDNGFGIADGINQQGASAKISADAPSVSV